MRFVIVSMLSLILLGLGFLLPSQSHESEKTTPGNQSDAHSVPEASHFGTQVTTKKMFTAFRSPLEKIAPDAARSEILTIAKHLFGDHPLVDEWVLLCFQLRRDGKGSFLELKRFAELQNSNAVRP